MNQCMTCGGDMRVIDSRATSQVRHKNVVLVDAGAYVFTRRRIRCIECGYADTTYEGTVDDLRAGLNDIVRQEVIAKLIRVVEGMR